MSDIGIRGASGRFRFRYRGTDEFQRNSGTLLGGNTEISVSMSAQDVAGPANSVGARARFVPAIRENAVHAWDPRGIHRLLRATEVSGATPGATLSAQNRCTLSDSDAFDVGPPNTFRSSTSILQIANGTSGRNAGGRDAPIRHDPNSLGKRDSRSRRA